MRMLSWIGSVAVGLAVCSGAAMAQESDRIRTAYEGVYPPSAETSYMTIGGKSYDALVYRPEEWRASDKRPAIVLFFGGGWRMGSSWQFAPHAAHFQKEGYVVVLPNYRVKERDGTTLVDSARDARSALRWVKGHADELGIDPDRVIAGGGSAGGHLAAASPVVDLNNEGDDLSIDPAPAALLLFNPAADLGALFDPGAPVPEEFGVTHEEVRRADPAAHVGANYPPCIIFHGTGDTTVPYPTIVSFVEKVDEAGGDCELVPFEGREHGFFNLSRSEEDWEKTLRLADAFLAERGLAAD